MPWTASDAMRHTHKASSPIARRQWSDVANAGLKRGLSEGDAIREANAAVAKRRRRPDAQKLYPQKGK